MDKKYFLMFVSILTILSISSVFASSSISGAFKVASSGGQIKISGSYCGNNILETGEQCDGTDLGGKTCNSLLSPLYGGSWTGTLSCQSGCYYDISKCSLIQTPTSNPSSSSGGGSSGGGGTPSNLVSTTPSSNTGSCVESWQCSDWSDGNSQCGTRTCSDLNKCGTTDLKPVVLKKCESTGFFSLFGITGGAIGAFATSGPGIVLILAIVLMGLLIVFFSLKKKTTKNTQDIAK